MQSQIEPIKERDYLLDNVKAILIFSVILAHFYKVGSDFRPASFEAVVYLISFSYIMQGFLFAAGYFAKNVEKARKTSIKALLFPYLVLMPIMYLVRYAVYGYATIDMRTPTMALWFMLTLFYYRFFLKDMAKVKMQWLIPLSIIVSLVSGCVAAFGEDYSLARTFGFLPFFILGYYCQKEHIEKIRQIPKAIGVVVFAGLVAFCALIVTQTHLSLASWYMKSDYASCGLTNLEGIGLRIVICVAAALWIGVFINLAPRKKMWLTKIGQNTMAVYVLHIVVRYILDGADSMHSSDPGTLLLLTAIAAASVWVFSRSIIADSYQRFMDGLYELLAKPLRRLLVK